MNHEPGGSQLPRSGLNLLIVVLIAIILVVAIGIAGLCQRVAPATSPPTNETVAPGAGVDSGSPGPSSPILPTPVEPSNEDTDQPGIKPGPPPGGASGPDAGPSPSTGAVRDEWGIIAIPPQGPIKIGFAAALSGPYQSIGVDEENAIKLAVADKMAAGGIKGHQIVIESVDDRCYTDPAVSVARQLGGDPAIIGVIGHMCSSSTLAALPAYEQSKLTVISPSATAVELAEPNSPVFFRVVSSDGYQGRIAADYLARSIKAQRLAIVHDWSSYGVGIAGAARSSFGLTGQVVAYEGIDRGQTDFTSVVSVLQETDPDAIYFGGLAADAARLVSALRQNQIEATFMSDEAVFDDTFIEQAGAAAEGTYVTAYRVANTTISQQFRQRYEQQYGPIGPYSRQAYDAAIILMNAVERVSQTQPDGVLLVGKKTLNDAVRFTRCDNCVSGQIWFEENGDRAESRVGIFQVQDGKFEEVSASD